MFLVILRISGVTRGRSPCGLKPYLFFISKNKGSCISGGFCFAQNRRHLSPKRTQALRSVKSQNRGISPLAITRAKGPGTAPAEISKDLAVSSAYRNPVQAAFKSNAGISSGSPKASWTKQAVEGVEYSGVKVATRQRPISSGSRPERARAAQPALNYSCAPFITRHAQNAPAPSWSVKRP